MIKCLICNKEFNTFYNISNHIQKVHKIKSKEYYDNFLKKENDGKCLVCNKETKFKTLRLGYNNYCSKNCCNKSNIRLTKIKFKLNYVDIAKKIKNSCLKNYGVDNPSKIIEIQNKKINHINKIKKINNILYKNNLTLIKWLGSDFIIALCNKHNITFDIRTHYIYLKDRNGLPICPYCYISKYGGNISKSEKELLDFIKENYNGQIIENSKQIIPPYELDIYIPDLKLAFEYNGLYWHSELNKPKDYHLIKTEECEKQGIHLIHIYEDDWLYKQNIVKFNILNLLNKLNKIYIKKYEIYKISFKEAKEFLINNYIQGYCNSDINLGLYNNNELLLIMTFNKLVKKGHYELLRFCSLLNTVVIGGANKLFNYFIDNYNPKYIVSYADRSWIMNSDYNIYNELGFKLIDIIKPSYIENTYKVYNSGSLKYELKM